VTVLTELPIRVLTVHF